MSNAKMKVYLGEKVMTLNGSFPKSLLMATATCQSMRNSELIN